MTVEADINALNTTVTNLDTEIKVDKAKLDSMEADAEALKTDASTYSTLASDYATEASTLKTAAQAYSTSIGSASPIVDLTALATSKSIWANDLYIYDTAKDSDGGAWRYKTQGTSWYNETLNTATRGSRREFPALAVIVGESNKLTIYDGDDPSLPMWKVFTTTSATTYEGFWYSTQDLKSVVARQGCVLMAIGSGSNASGVRILDFAGDEIRRYASTLNNGSTYYTGTMGSIVEGVNNVCRSSGLNPIGGNTVYDIDVEVRSDAPVNPKTGLSNLTVALATNGGLSLIRQDGTVTTKDPGSPNTIWKLSMAGTKIVYSGGTSTGYWGQSLYDYETDQITLLGSHAFGLGLGVNWGDARVLLTDENNFVGLHHDGAFRGTSYYTQALGYFDHTDYTKTLTYRRNGHYVSGWLTQNTVVATLMSTTPGVHIEAVDFFEDFTSADSVTNWTPVGAGNAVAWDSVNNGLTVTTGPNQYYGKASLSNMDAYLRPNETYIISFDVLEGQNSAYLAAVSLNNSNLDASVIGKSNTNLQVGSYAFPAETGSTVSNQLQLRVGPGFQNAEVTVTNIKAQVGIADRSTPDKHFIVRGKITRRPVAEGAELVGYSGFSADNYFEQAYSSDLDFGTGDFCIMGWFDLYNAYQDILTRAESTGLSAGAWRLYNHAAGVLRFYWHNGTSEVYGSQTSAPVYQQFSFLVIKRESGVLSIYQNNNLLVQFAHTDSLTCSGAVFSTKGADLRTQMALLRISTTAPTAEQIRKIYEDERVLFQPGAKCTIAQETPYMAVPTVLGLAYDSDTDLLYVGTDTYDITDEKLSVFKGLRRISYKNGPVAKAVAAAKGMVIDE